MKMFKFQALQLLRSQLKTLIQQNQRKVPMKLKIQIQQSQQKRPKTQIQRNRQ